MGRSPCCEKNGLKKGPWTAEEDQKLIDYIQKNGYGNWRTLPKNAGLQRCGKSCRLRWTNYLRPDIKRGRFTFEEEETIIQLHSVLGNKWSAIAARLPGRTDNEIKNYWNTHIRKRLLRMGIDPVTHSPRLDLLDISSILSSSCYSSPRTNIFGVQPIVNPELLRLAASILSSQRTQNPNFVHQENQFGNPNQIQESHLLQLQNQSHQSHLIQDIPSCAPLNTPNCVSFTSDESSQLQEPNVDQLPSSFDPQTCELNDWQNNLDAFINAVGYQEHIVNPQSNLTSSDFDFTSHLSTPSSSPAPLKSNSNSNSTNYINGSSTEDDREISYCSNSLFKYEYQEILDSNVFM